MKKIIKGIIVSGVLASTALGLSGCNKEVPSCGEGNHTYEYFISKDAILNKAQQSGITQKEGEEFAQYLSDFNADTLQYDSEYDSDGVINYQKQHYSFCTTCGDIKLENHNLTVNAEGTTETTHNITCDLCDYTHEKACNFKGENQEQEDSADGECFCGNHAPMFAVEERSSNTVRLTVEPSAKGEVVIPETYNGKTVTEVAFGKIQGAETHAQVYTYNNLTAVTIPASVTKVYGLDSYTAVSTVDNNFPNLTSLNILGVINGASANYSLFTFGGIADNLKTLNAPNCYLGIWGFDNLETLTFKGGQINNNVTTVNITSLSGFSVNSVEINTLNIAETVTTISNNIFGYGNNIKIINATGVKTVGEGAFQSAENLEEFNAPKLEFIGANAFNGCKNLSKVTWENVAFFGEKCFYNCSKITKLQLETTKDVEIRENAFSYNSDVVILEKFRIVAPEIKLYGCATAKNVFLSANTINLYSSIGSSETEEITLEGNIINFFNETYDRTLDGLSEKFTTLNYNVAEVGQGVMNGYLYSANENLTYNIGAKVKQLPVTFEMEHLGITPIPFCKVVFDGDCQIETIGAFTLGHLTATEIELPSTVKTVEDFAFFNSKIERITHSKNLFLKHSAIYGCANYEYDLVNGIYYFEGHTAVGVEENASGALIIKDGTKYIDSVVEATAGGTYRRGFFNNINNEVTLVMPNSVIEIASEEDFGMFSSSYLKGVTLSTSLTEIPSMAFYSCTGLTEISIPQGVEKIGKEAFAFNSISTLTIPDSVKIIEEGAFYRSYILTTLNLGNGITDIAKNAFSSCEYLTTVNFGNNLKTIGENAFASSKIEVLNLPTSLVTLEDGAFSDSNNLTTINFNIGLETIGENAFADCSNLGEVTLPNGLKTLGAYAFFNSGLTKVVIPEGVTEIKEHTFNNCNNLVIVELPTSLLKIGYASFGYCESIQTITLPENVEEVSEYAFGGCDKLETINVLSNLILDEKVTTDSNLYKGQLFDNAYYKGKKLTALKDSTKTFIYIKPGTTEIAQGVFTGLTTLKAVFIPTSMTTIAKNEFLNCTNVKLLFESSSHITNLGIDYSTQVVRNAHVTKDGFLWTFQASTQTSTITGYYGEETELTIPATILGNNVTMIGLSAFANNTTLEKVIIGENIIDIYGGAFKNCTALKEVSISSYLYMLNNMVFSGCTSLQKVDIKGADFKIYSTEYDFSNGIVSAEVSVADENLVKYLTNDYCNYLWVRNIQVEN